MTFHQVDVRTVRHAVLALAMLCTMLTHSANLHCQTHNAGSMKHALDSVLSTCTAPTSIAVIDLHDPSLKVVEGHVHLAQHELEAQPGSTMKPLLAYLAAKAGDMSPGESIVCSGDFGEGFSCFAKHGRVDLPKSLATSCNAFAYEVTSRLGSKTIVDGFKAFGFPKPDSQITETPTMAFVYGTGHKHNYLTPRHVATAYARLLGLLQNPDKAVAAESCNEIRSGMNAAVNEPYGTAHAIFDSTFTISGKSGRAEGVRKDTSQRASTWFVGYAPSDTPQYVVAVLMLGEPLGSTRTAQIARSVLQAVVRNE